MTNSATTPIFDIVAYSEEMKEEVCQFLCAVWQSLGREWQPTGLDADVYQIPVVYQRGGGEFWVVREAGKVIATAALRLLSETIAELKRFYISPEYRGRLGRDLFRIACERARKHQFHSLRLDTGNASLQRVLRRAGFRDIPAYNENTVSTAFKELSFIAERKS